jgi:hypothetical protein
MFEAFHQWVDQKLRVDAYELRGDEIVATGLPRQRFRLGDIRTWQSVYIGGGVPSICVEFADGRKIDYSDKHEQLFHILHQAVADRELPFTTA